MNTGDLAWVLISAALVWLMTPGLALSMVAWVNDAIYCTRCLYQF